MGAQTFESDICFTIFRRAIHFSFSASFLLLSSCLNSQNDAEIKLLKDQIETMKQSAQNNSKVASNIGSNPNWKPLISCPDNLKFNRSQEVDGTGNVYREYCYKETSDGIQIKVGQYVRRYDSGELYVRSQYNSDGLVHGLVEVFYKSGKKMSTRTSLNGKDDGEVIEYDETGEVTSKTLFKEGVQISGVSNPTIAIEKLKIYQFHPTISKIDIRVTNNSSGFINHWRVDASIYDIKGNYLASGMTNGENLKSGESVISDIAYHNVQAKSIERWEPKIGSMYLTIDGKNFDATKEFSLKEK